MKKTGILLLIFAGALCFTQPVQAQGFLKKMADKALKKTEEKAGQRAEDKMDQQIDKGLDKVEDSLAKDSVSNSEGEVSPEARQQQRMMKGMGMSGEPVPIEKEYDFNYSTKMVVKSYKKDGTLVSDGILVTFMNPGRHNFAYEFEGGSTNEGSKGNGIYIFDFKNKATIILHDQDGKRTGLVYGLDLTMNADSLFAAGEEMPDNATDMSTLNPNLKKTGRTKNIAGYKCEEYVYDDEKERADIWITRDVKLQTRDLMSAVFKSAMYSNGMPWGFFMESESLDKETGERSVLTVTEVNKNRDMKFDLSQYQVTNMGSIKMLQSDQK
ncbi:DUF4412 domain-containing protein [Prolixibacter sp. SD074]|uniref:DUF4412 domain-containing protein n=1 Tax=Prolixibacter sp. SD074 TaxID=2652391 RepID=UPI00126C0FB7|nr:DUF4412 domain-containing protein [Prolixibacter sp. SD074]GET28390.1 hypothetical protein SD074_05920 [Prolixibacter sp. SD074]